MIYSNDLATVISALLKVDPAKRPTSEEILSNPTVQKRYNGEIITNDTSNDCDELLKTIKYNPHDLRGLKKILPKSNYEEEMEEKKI